MYFTQRSSQSVYLDLIVCLSYILVVFTFLNFFFFPNCQLCLLTTLSGFRLSSIFGGFFKNFFSIRKKFSSIGILLILKSFLKVSGLGFSESHDVLGFSVSVTQSPFNKHLYLQGVSKCSDQFCSFPECSSSYAALYTKVSFQGV